MMTLPAVNGRLRWEFALFPLLILLFFILYTYPVFEGDLFWHLNTGQWIWEHRGLPKTDPFSFTVDQYPASAGSSRVGIVLTQYWLGQLLLYGLWSVAGYKGIILARAVCYSLILAVLWLWSRQTARGIIPFTLLFIVGAQLLRYSNERPQLFGFLLATLVFFQLERLRMTKPATVGRILLLPLLMLVWANIHGSFLLGVVTCLLYGVVHLFRSRAGDIPFSKAYFAALCASCAVAWCNPNGFSSLMEFAGTEELLLTRTVEFQSPLKSLFVQHLFDPYWLLLVPVVVLLVCRWKRFAPEHFFLLALLAVFSLTGGRYIPFFLFASPLALNYLPPRTIPASVELVLALLILLLFLRFNFKSSWTFRESSDFPRQAVAFLDSIKPTARVFNHIVWGGYISRFAPGCKVFLDGRLLVVDALREHAAAMNGTNWKELFSRHQVDVVMVPARRLDHATMTYGNIVPLVAALLQDSDWVLVYRDQLAVVFVRNLPGNEQIIRRYRISG